MRLAVSAKFPLPDVLALLVCAFVNALILCFAYRLSRGLGGKGRRAAALDTNLVYLAVINLAVVVPGAIGALRPSYALALSAGASMIGIWRLRRQRPVPPPRSRRPALEKIVPTGARALSLGWLALFGVLCGHVAVNGLWRFPEEFDGLAYHIPLIDHWLQAKSLYAPGAAWWWTSGNAEVVGLWMVAPFSGDFLVTLVNVPFIILWGRATFEVAAQVGLSAAWRHLGVLTVLAVHTLFHEAEKAMNDVAVAACFFAAVAFGFRYYQSRRDFDMI
ncbi:MAG: hypothetical protein ACREHD_24520, partial [Pirellulales bacterium]